MKTYLNLGCGQRFLPEWTNVDMVSRSPHVLAHNLNQRLPFQDDTFEFIYMSHVLEHFTKEEGRRLVQECARLLRPGGTLRVIVPDLEKLVRLYLEAMQGALQGCQRWQENYEWAVIMLYDQAVRTQCGGLMLDYLRRRDVRNEHFVRQACGSQISEILNRYRAARQMSGEQSSTFGKLYQRLGDWFSRERRHKVLRALLGRPYEAYRLGKFRMGGEVHQWMYDRYSLSLLLKESGFTDVLVCGPEQSALPGWSQLHLDTEADGAAYKPESLYMEGAKRLAASRAGQAA